MNEDTQEAMNQMAGEWLEARQVIMDFLKELQPYQPRERLGHNAAAIIARLSHAGFVLTKVGD